MTRRVRVGVIGAGSWACAVHLPLLARDPNVDLVVVSRRDPQLAQAIATRFGARHWTADWREAIDRPLDAVVVASPAGVHEEQVVAALEGGAHVLCEKPLATTAAAAWRMVEAARRAERRLIVAFGWNYMQIMRSGREYVTGGSLGEVEYLSVALHTGARGILMGDTTYASASHIVAPRSETFTDLELAGGGFVATTLSHAYALALYLSGLQPAMAFGQSWDGPAAIDLHDVSIIRFTNGAIGSVHGACSSPVAQSPEWHVAVVGSLGALTIDSAAPRLRFASNEGDVVDVELPPDAGRYRPGGPLDELLAVARDDAIEGPAGAAELGATVVQIVEAVRRSAAIGQPLLLRRS